MASQGINEEEPAVTGEPVTREEHGATRKRATPDSGLPPKPKKKFAKRAEVWQHFIQRVEDDKFANCRYCGTEIKCDTKTVGTSPMKGHIERCKMYKDHVEREKQTVLGGDKSGNMRVIKYDPQLFRRSVNELVVMASQGINEEEPAVTGEPVTREEHGATRKRATPDSGLPPKPKKKFAKRAEVWQHFIQRVEDDKFANCRYCGTEIKCDTKTVGTSPMKGHIERCKMYKDHVEREKQTVLGGDKSGNMRVIKYDPQLFRRSVNELVVVNELPFSFVESEGWKRFCFNILPIYKTFSRRTCCRDIVGMYLQEKEELKHLFSVQKQRISLTTYIWVSSTTSVNYMVVTGHWIDENWEMQKRILSFKVVTDHKGSTIAGQLLDCLEEWGIQKVFTVTVDNAKGNDKALKEFKDEMRLRGGEALVRDGDFIHMRCCAHILNLIVGDSLKVAKPSIVAIRNAIKYVRSSFNRVKSFVLRCDSGKVCRGSLPMDVPTRWNSTYLMLTSALKLRVPFERMLSEDKLYDDYFLEIDEQTKKKRVGPPLFLIGKMFQVTSSLCYNEIVNIERNLITKCGNSNEKVRKDAHTMRDKFEKYWDGLINMNPLVIVASVFDPRNKMQFANLCIEQLYGKDTVECKQLTSSVSSVMKKLYEEYNFRHSKPIEVEEPADSEPAPTTTCELSDDDDEDGCERMEVIYNKLVNSKRKVDGCSELDIYLNEKTEMRVETTLGFPYDVLSWWKCNSQKFPILSEVAKDVLAIQVSSVASESVFSTSGRILDPYRSSLTPYMVEMLLCTQQWLRVSFKTQAEVANLVQMLEEAAFFESLDSRNAMLTQFETEAALLSFLMSISSLQPRIMEAALLSFLFLMWITKQQAACSLKRWMVLSQYLLLLNNGWY
ncbi:PREDICTED: zinc finger BED domain-containing protein RICESLEEPER 2-like [Camelina sativa]|uniref:Zinc finger BED domain-containing protein RICESLEEPER 2-like n=1 Tax=Camelina sativa TaxID=90675 RepID=A0ABM0ZBT4_CAMSA|nr:PREDICTED: zinc finger BED domain-containing protein RICESLEEPER 2-like [Camelina sativa]